MKMKSVFWVNIILFIWYFQVAYNQQILINEVQYVNRQTILDQNGEAHDWIEIYNKNNETVNLIGYMLTDDTSKSAYWTFPEYELEPDSFVLIFASGTSQKTPPFHADFKLKIMEDPVYLLNPGGRIIDQIKVRCVPSDLSIGRPVDGEKSLYVLEPTPGLSNNDADTVTINFHKDSLLVNHQSGIYAEPLEICFDHQIKSNSIYFSLNGDDLNEKSDVYNSRLILNDISQNKNRFANKTDSDFEPGDLIAKANILRAQVFSEGCPASNEIINTYFIGENNWENYQVPIVSMITDKENLFDEETGIYVFGKHENYSKHGGEWERKVHLEVFDEAKEQIIDQNAGIRIHGRGSRRAPQKSFRLFAKEKYGKETFDYPFFEQKAELESFKTLILRSTRGWSGVLLKDELCHSLVQNMNIDYTATQTTILYINGEYWGIYSLRERHDQYYVENNFGVVNPELNIIGHDKENIILEEGSRNKYNKLLSDLESKDPRDPFFYSDISEQMDLDNLMDYYIAQIYFGNTDFPNNNYEMWCLDNDTSRWRFFFFDLDGGMIRYNYNHLAEYNNSIEDFQRYQDYSTFVLRQLLRNDEFRNAFNARFRYHMNKTFSSSTVLEAISKYETIYEPLVNEQIYRWETPSDYLKWKHNVDMLKQFAMQRPFYMNDQLSENFGNPFVLFPNPAKEQINIKLFCAESTTKIELFSLGGSTVFEGVYQHENSITIAPNLASGVYLLRLEIDNMIYSEKIIIQP